VELGVSVSNTDVVATNVTPTASFCMTNTSCRDNVPNFNHFPGERSIEANLCVVCQPARFLYLNA